MTTIRQSLASAAKRLSTGGRTPGGAPPPGGPQGVFDLNGSPVTGITTGPSMSASVLNGSVSLSIPDSRKYWLDCDIPAIGAWTRDSCTVSGGFVDTMPDQSGCGATASETLTARPAYDATGWSDGGPCVTFTAASSQRLAITGCNNKLHGRQPRTLAMLVRQSDNATYSLFGIVAPTGPKGCAFQNYSTYANIYVDWLANDATSTPVFDTANDRLVVFEQSPVAGGSCVYIDGVKHTFPTLRMSDLDAIVTSCTIGSHGSSNYWSGRMHSAILFSGLLGSDGYKHLCRRTLGGNFTRVVCDGNSLTQGSFGGGGVYPTVLQAALGARNLGRFAVSNIGQGGQTTDDMITRYPTWAAPLYSQHQTNILVAWELSNQWLGSYSGGGTPRQAVNKLWEYCALARATGFSVVVATATYRTAAQYTNVGSKTIGDAGIAEMNGYVRAEWQGHANALADVCAHPMFVNPADTSNTYIYADGVHLAQAADDVVAGIMAKPVRALINSIA